MSARFNRPDATGRSNASRFARLDHKMLEEPTYRALSPNARALLVELAMMEDGKNNGTLYLSVRDAADRMGVSDPHTAGAAFAELEARGFIRSTAEAHFAVKAGDGSRARQWRLTWVAVAGKHGPTSEYAIKNLDGANVAEPAPKTKDRKRMLAGQAALKRWKQEKSITPAEEKMAVRKNHTLNDIRVRKNHTTASAKISTPPRRVQENHTRSEPKPEIPPFSVVQDFHTHTAVPAGGAALSPCQAPAARDTCERCGDPITFEKPARGKPKRFCSERCRKADEARRARDRKRGQGEPHLKAVA